METLKTILPSVYPDIRKRPCILERFFDIARDANPILDKERFLQDYRRSLCSPELVSAIALITAKLIGREQFSHALGLDTSIERMLSSSLLEEEIVGDFPSLDQFRKACILAFYEFHQFPGNQSWMRVGKLTRMAYRIGLDRLEVLRVRYDEWKTVSYEDIQEWRSIWWCIYRLDAYSNLSSGTPFLIEDSLIDTSLVVGKQILDDEQPPELYVSQQVNSLWRLVPAITAHPETMVPNIHNITIAAVRQMGLVTRLHFLRPREETLFHLATVSQHLSEFRMSLPPGWLNPRRNAFTAESQASHHERMVSVLLLLMAQLLLSILHCAASQGNDWLVNWQRVYQTCQDIALVAEQWDSSFCLKVDPAICLTTLTALVFLELHRKSATTNVFNIDSEIDHEKTVLYLQLEQFASVWTLPRLLILSFKSFSESVPGPLSNSQISLILSRFEAPLHPRWLQFLSSAQVILDAAA
ncbi:hypothetical protein BO94DRAFT_560715 [Aspergillus sclerotioniger CBS 115572]|uniref:Xylanolytic transcriptional activator regulatory domain-containing protein n=1 Tax=Aspergillus sclerotioniger CBS 115572 TaxID=1450535 RepID=A0A317V5L7_9EURO|nr:hypothetical protein BO94DRAFT_560715 [Aspergillus sclerotioniger CBS 115572]PWY69604.1 hypothetical protein BO94DRAFT_560715 [Aspergillus sclerotioniger CBS 115572]